MFCILYRFLNLFDTISFDMSCFHCAVWCSDRCIVFSKLLKWKVLLFKNFISNDTVLHLCYQIPQPFPGKTNAKQKLSVFHSKSGEKVIPLLCLYSHAGHIQQIFSQYRSLAYSADLRWKIETFAFFKELATFCKMSADNTSQHEWEKFC